MYRAVTERMGRRLVENWTLLGILGSWERRQPNGGKRIEYRTNNAGKKMKSSFLVKKEKENT